MRSARWVLTFILAAQAVSAFALDWTPNHLLNPLWHPHARFHGGLLLFYLAGTSATGLWLLWRRTAEPRAAGLVVPGASPSAGGRPRRLSE